MPNQQRDNSVWATYIYPFTVVKPSGEPEYSVPLEQINSISYDHGKLCSFVAALPLGPGNAMALVCFDGALALPRNNRFACPDSAQEMFNRILCCLLLGGFACEAIDKRDIVSGSIHEERSLWPVDLGRSHNAALHGRLRMRAAGTMDTILLSKPNSISVGELVTAFSQGQRVLESFDSLSPTFLLRAHTELNYHAWSAALSNLWVVVEQLTSQLWKQLFLADETRQPAGMPKRIKSLTDDSRTWSTSVRHEILFQVGLLEPAVYAPFFAARKARNDLVHEGRTPNSLIVEELFSATVSLMEKVSKVSDLGVRKLSEPDDRSQRTGVETGAELWRRLEEKYQKMR